MHLFSFTLHGGGACLKPNLCLDVLALYFQLTVLWASVKSPGLGGGGAGGVSMKLVMRLHSVYLLAVNHQRYLMPFVTGASMGSIHGLKISCQRSENM